MPDMQSELSKVINQWESPALPQAFKPTNNASRVTFNYVQDNPGVARKAAVSALAKQGYKESSTSSLLSQMVRHGLVRDANGGLFTTQPEYTPIKPSRLRTDKTRRYTKAKAAKKPEFDVVASPVGEGFNAEAYVNNLPLKHAKAVYEELKKVFA